MHILMVTNMYPTERVPFAGPFVKAQVQSLQRLGVEVDVLHIDRPEGGRGAYRTLAAKLRRLVADIQPDVVHAAYGGVLAATVVRVVRDRPVLVTFHGSDLLGRPGNGRIGNIAPRVGVAASRFAARRASGVIVVSKTLAAVLPRGTDRARTWVVPNGVDLERFFRRDQATCQATLGWNARARHVLFPSSPSRPEKRYALAEAAVQRLGGEPPVHLHAMDGIPHDEVPTWLNAADVVLLTSTHEGSPVVVKEALACGIPIVSLDVGDVRERIEAVDGCYLAAATPEDLAEKLELALAGGSRVDAEAHVAELSLENVAVKVRDIYNELVSRNRGER